MRFNQTDFRTEPLGIDHSDAGHDPEFLGLVTGAYAAGGVGYDRKYGDRPYPQFRVQLLFDRGEIGIVIDEKGTHLN